MKSRIVAAGLRLGVVLGGEHETLKTTSAVASGLTDKQWTIRELLERAAVIHK